MANDERQQYIEDRVLIQVFSMPPDPNVVVKPKQESGEVAEIVGDGRQPIWPGSRGQRFGFSCGTDPKDVERDDLALWVLAASGEPAK